MKKILLFLLIGLSIGVFFFQKVTSQTSHKPSEVLSVSTNATQPQNHTSPSSQPVEEIIENPERFTIPKLNVDAEVEKVGLDEKKNMAVPVEWQNVGWYKLGYKIGQTGSAVIAGHYDTPQGTPGVFYDLSDLKPGDEIEVTGDGKTLTFEVIKTAVFRFDEVPLQEVFASTDQKRLNLITCSGVFDKNDKNYSNRLVVYSVLKE